MPLSFIPQNYHASLYIKEESLETLHLAITIYLHMTAEREAARVSLSNEKSSSGGKEQHIQLLDLPAELVEEIMHHLPAHTLQVLERTCRSIRRLCHMVSDGTAPSREEYLRYLTCCTREIIDVWICKWCMAPHPYSYDDFPSNRLRPLGCKEKLGAVPLDSYYAACWGYSLALRHVQFALKYARLGQSSRYSWHQRQEQRLYFEQLLAPRHTTIPTQPFDRCKRARYSAWPKIAEGNFLLHSMWTYPMSGASQRFDERMMGLLRICSHQTYFYGAVSEGEQARQSMYNLLRRHDQIELVQSNPWTADRRVHDEQLETRVHNALPSVISRAKQSPRCGEIAGSCPACPTDFSVEISQGMAVIRSWQDLGRESSPLDTLEKPQPQRHRPSRTLHHESIPHDLGMVRRKYEGLLSI